MADDRFNARPRPGGPGGPGNFGAPGGPGGDRGGFGGPGGDRGGFDRPRFPRPAGPPPAGSGALGGPLHSVRLKNGDLEIEVSGSAAFVRQTIDDLPIVLAKLRGEIPPRPAAISMPTAPAHEPASVPVQGTPVGDASAGRTLQNGAFGDANGARNVAAYGASSANASQTNTSDTNGAAGSDRGLETAILAVIRREGRPLAVAAIRKRLTGDVTAQQVRRTLERSSKVAMSDDRPATYTLR